jgi:hypothetical protein
MRAIIIVVLGLVIGCGGNSAISTDHPDGNCNNSSGEGGQSVVTDGGSADSGGRAGNEAASGSGGAAGADHETPDSNGGVGNDANSGIGGSADAGMKSDAGNGGAMDSMNSDAGDGGATDGDSGLSRACDPEARTQFLTEAPRRICEAMQTTDCVKKNWQVFSCIRQQWRRDLTPAEANYNGGSFWDGDPLCGSGCEKQMAGQLGFIYQLPQHYDVPWHWREYGSPTVQEIVDSCTSGSALNVGVDTPASNWSSPNLCEGVAKDKFLAEIPAAICTGIQQKDCTAGNWKVLACVVQHWRPDWTAAMVEDEAAKLLTNSGARGTLKDTFCQAWSTQYGCALDSEYMIRTFSPPLKFLDTPPDWHQLGSPTAQQLVDSCSQ